jgi:hypothetical protein
MVQTKSQDIHNVLNNPALWYAEIETKLPLRLVLMALINADTGGKGLATLDLRDFHRDYLRCVDFYDLDKATKFLDAMGVITRKDNYIHNFTSIHWYIHRGQLEVTAEAPPPADRGSWQISPKLRIDIYRSDNFQCVYCHKEIPTEKLTLDHVIPRLRGGSDTRENLVTCCQSCNSKKGSRTPMRRAWCGRKGWAHMR